MAEKGRTGTEVLGIAGGSISRPFIPSTILGDDYQSDWTIDTIDKMLRGDGQVAGVWNAIKLSILQSDWFIKPHSKDKRDVEIAEWAEKQIKPHWDDFLRQGLDYLPYGFFMFEPIYTVEDGQIVWERLAPRLPFTVDSWKPEKGHVKEVVQYAYDYKTEGYQSFTIPGKKILRLTNDQSGENFEGSSIFRGAYKHWLMKDTLYKIAAIRHERWGVGTPIGALPPNAQEETIDEFKDILKGLRSNEYGYVYAGEVAGSIDLDQIIDILVPKGGQAGSQDLMELIRHHDLLIARSALAQFLNLGETEHGSRQVSSDAVNLFLMNLEAITKYVSSVISSGNKGENRGLQELIDKNFDNVEGYPYWVCGRTKKTDSAAISAVVAQLVQSGAMEPDDSLEEYLRQLIGLPKEKRNPRQVETVTRKRDEVQASESNFRAKFEERRELYDWEEHVAFAEIEATLDRSVDDFVGIWRDVLDDQLEAIGKEVGPNVTREDLSRLDKIELPLGAKLASRFEGLLGSMQTFGKVSVKAELLRQATNTTLQEEDDETEWPDEDEAAALIAAQADKSAEYLNERTKTAIRYWALAGLSTVASVSWASIADSVRDLSDGPVRIEGYWTGWAYGLGRNIAGDYYSDVIGERYYSALMDACAVCLPMDGARYSIQPFQTPNPNCEGGIGRCRCITVYALQDGVTLQDIRSI